MKAEYFLAWIVFLALDLSAQTIQYELVNLGKKVNSRYHDAGPVISADGNILYFFVTDHPDNRFGRDGSQDIWCSEKDSRGEWGEPKHLGSPLNIHHFNQVFTVFPDGQTLLVRGGKSKDKKGFSLIRKQGRTWSQLQELKIKDFNKMNQGKFYGASMSSDQKYVILYFSEKENSAASDLYLSKKLADGDWTRPQKLPANINTVRDEFGPFLAPDNKTMYFSSKRKDKGLGNADIYKTTRLDNTWMKWSEPENVGKPINTRAFDAYMSVDAVGNVFATQSGALIDGGNLDIFWLRPKKIEITLMGLVQEEKTKDPLGAQLTYRWKGQKADTLADPYDGTYKLFLPGEGRYTLKASLDGYQSQTQELTLEKVYRDTTLFLDFSLLPFRRNVVLSGTVYNMKTNKILNASVKGYARSSRESFRTETSNGYYESEISSAGWHIITAAREGFLNCTDSVRINPEKETLVTKDLHLIPIAVGATVRLNNIFFDFDKTTLKKESFPQLNEVVDFLQDNPSVEVEISGHTDSKGSDGYNLKLSQGRAEAVVSYLINRGVVDSRLIAKGYGESKPVSTNSTDAGRATNRRVEFTVLKN